MAGPITYFGAQTISLPVSGTTPSVILATIKCRAETAVTTYERTQTVTVDESDFRAEMSGTFFVANGWTHFEPHSESGFLSLLVSMYMCYL